MNRPAPKLIVSTALMAIAAMLVWLFSIGDRCLATHIANHLTERNPRVIASTPLAESTDDVQVENPYGVMTCHYQATSAEQVLNVSVFAIVCFAIGWLTARRIPHRPLLIAAAITTMTMLIALSLQYWVHREDIDALRAEAFPRLLAVLVFFLIASGIAMFGAWAGLRFSRRV
jgi:ABC-type Na+ efflux pump permease subunit